MKKTAQNKRPLGIKLKGEIHPSYVAQIEKHESNADVYQADLDLLAAAEKKAKDKAKRKKEDSEN